MLAFDDLGGDERQERLADAFAEDLITELARSRDLLVIARNSSFTYKGKPVDVRQVGRELGVRYVLEGSPHRRARAGNGAADRCRHRRAPLDRALRSAAGRLFAVHDEVIGEITSAPRGRADRDRADAARSSAHRQPRGLRRLLRPEQHVYGGESAPLSAALSFYEKAIALDPGFADAYAGYARAAVDVWQFDYSNVLLGAVARKRGYEAAGRALQLDPDQGRAYTVLGILQVVDRAYDEAIASGRKAVALDAGSAEARLNLAVVPPSRAGPPRPWPQWRRCCG